MIKSKKELREYLEADSKNYKNENGSLLKRIKVHLLSNPISEQKYIWLYIKTLRLVEYYEYKRSKRIIYVIPFLFYLYKLRKYSHVTGFQIPPHTCGRGVTIWHWGSIIINPATKIGANCTLYPGVLIGHKTINGGAAVIGDNVFIGAGTKIIGAVKIGNNVIIGQNCVITKDVPDNSIVVNSHSLRYL